MLASLRIEARLETLVAGTAEMMSFGGGVRHVYAEMQGGRTYGCIRR